MSEKYIDAEMLERMFISGAYNLEANKEWINELNVFPVPDGDTGTNMTLTILSAVSEVKALGNAAMPELSKAISHGSLRGARGNSGVILSQLLRGFSKTIQDHERIDQKLLAAAMERAVETAYKAVMRPKEGTILTVAKGVARKAVHIAKDNITLDEFMTRIIEEGEKVLAATPDMLPVLKEAGVVDSGGQGLIVVLKGAYAAYAGKPVEAPKTAQDAAVKPAAKTDVKRPEGISNSDTVPNLSLTLQILYPIRKWIGLRTSLNRWEIP